jgi:hypothetical protein
MLHKCANPVCPSVFRSLGMASSFYWRQTMPQDRFTVPPSPMNRRERLARRVERYWLCDHCSSLLTLSFERGRGMVTVPLAARNMHVSAVQLTPIQPAMKGYQHRLERAL